MPDGVASVRMDPHFAPMQDGDFFAFRAAAKGALRDNLERVQEIRVHQTFDAWTYRRGGVIRGIGAISDQTPWRRLLWSFPGELSAGDWKRIIRFVRLRTARTFDDPSLYRLEATARVDCPEACALLVRLGFEFEGVLQAYGCYGEPHMMFAITAGARET